jgi:TolA-binding protein
MDKILVPAAAMMLLMAGSLQAADSSAEASAKAQTLRLDDQGRLRQASTSRDEEFMQRVAEMKKLVDEGRPDRVRKAIKQLKLDFSEIAGADFNAFTDAEVLLARGKLYKAAWRYEKFLDDYPDSTLRDAALEREFQIASEFLAGRRKTVLIFKLRAYDDGIKIMEKISDRTGSADIAKNASLAVAQNYEKRKKYDQAYLKWSQISTRWPTGETGKDALLGMARTKYAAYRGPVFDASGLVSAKSYYENFRLRYPGEAQKIGVDEILSRIYEQLAEKNLLIAKYYERTGSNLAANLYYQMVVDTWPNSKAATTAREALNQK